MNTEQSENLRKSRLLPRLGGLTLTLALASAGGMAVGGDFELAGDPERGEQPYQLQCASCHGSAGQGDGPASAAFDPPPSDLTRPDLDAERMFIATRDGGMAVGLTAIMPPFGHSLDEQAIHDIVAYIKSLRE